MTTTRPERATFGAEAAYPRFLAEGLGRCAGDLFPDDFTEDGIERAQVAMRERARRVCLLCPFRRVCAEWALEHHAQGVYGATTTREREGMRRATRDQ